MRTHPFRRAVAAFAFSGAVLVSAHGSSLAAQQAPPAIDAATRRAVVDSLRSLLLRVYVDADTGRLIAEHIGTRMSAGTYDSLTDPGEFGRALTRDLRAVNQDQHLAVGFAPDAPVDRVGLDTLEFAGAGGGDDSAAVEAQARGFHYGLGKLELLTGNVGYAELTGFFDGPGAERMMLAAFEYLRDSDAIILDLRRHGGGSGDMSNWLLSHFVGRDSLLTLRIFERVNGRTLDRYTVAGVPGPRLPDVPLFILTSRGTASAAEDVTFVLDNLGRAVIVGDRTAGAGHNNTLLGLGHGMVASISFSRVTDPESGREWERVGITPDIAVPAEQALAAAHLAALDTLIADAAAEPGARRLRLLRETAEARYAPRAVPESRLRGYAGTYGDRHITLDGDTLRSRRGEGPESAMIALSDSTFTIEPAPAMRLQFRGTGPDMVLVVTQPDGRIIEIPRSNTRDPARSDTREAVARGIAEIFAANAAPGMSVVVVVDTAVLYIGGFGLADATAREPVTPETIFYIASSTKSFTALAAALLDRDGLLSLDAPVSRYLPELRLHSPLSPDSITIRELLTHTHGIAADGPVFFRTAYSGEHDPALLIRLAAEHPADERGGAFRYTNIGYNIASLAIDRAAGKSWKDVLQERVLAPAGMRRTTAYVSRAERRLLAQPYVPADTGFERIPYVKVDGNMHAAGGLVSTAADMARWLEVNINDGVLDGRRVFPAEIMREVHRLQVRHADSIDRWPRHGYALGWQVGTYAGDTLLHHFGGFPGFDAHVSYMPERRIGVAVLTNGGFGGGLMDQVSQYVYDVLASGADADSAAAHRRAELEARLAEARAGIAENRAERRARPQALPHPLDAYAGTYENLAYGRMVWAVENGRLVARIGALTSVAEAYRAADDILRVELIPGSGSTVRFTFEGDRAVRLAWDDLTFERVR